MLSHASTHATAAPLSLQQLLHNADIMENPAFKALSLDPNTCARLLQTSRAVRASPLVRHLLSVFCMRVPQDKRRALQRAVWAGLTLANVHAITTDEVFNILTTVSVLMPVVHVYNDNSQRSMQIRMRAFAEIRAAKVPEMLCKILPLPSCTGVAAERGLCCLQNCMVNIDGSGTFKTAIDLDDTELREGLVHGVLGLYQDQCERFLTNEVRVVLNR